MTKISVVITAFNEEIKIAGALESVKDFADEIIVIDNSSTDKTSTIAKKFTKKVYKQKNDPQKIDLQKNYGFSKATSDWILSLDADERLTQELIDEIKYTLVSSPPSILGYWIPRKNIIFGKWIQHSIWWPDYQLRLFKRGMGEFSDVHVHKDLHLEGRTNKLDKPMIHENYDSINQYLYKMVFIYTENEAKNIFETGTKVHWTDALRYPANDFLKTFFLQKGYKDGMHGLVLSILQAFYSEVVFAKVWEKQGFTEENSSQFLYLILKEFKKIQKEFQYWFLSAEINNTVNPVKKIMLRTLRKNVVKKINSDSGENPQE